MLSLRRVICCSQEGKTGQYGKSETLVNYNVYGFIIDSGNEIRAYMTHLLCSTVCPYQSPLLCSRCRYSTSHIQTALTTSLLFSFLLLYLPSSPLLVSPLFPPHLFSPHLLSHSFPLLQLFYHSLWAAKTGKCKHVFDGPTAHQGMVTCIAGSEDGDLIMTGE